MGVLFVTSSVCQVGYNHGRSRLIYGKFNRFCFCFVRCGVMCRIFRVDVDHIVSFFFKTGSFDLIYIFLPLSVFTRFCDSVILALFQSNDFSIQTVGDLNRCQIIHVNLRDFQILWFICIFLIDQGFCTASDLIRRTITVYREGDRRGCFISCFVGYFRG